MTSEEFQRLYGPVADNTRYGIGIPTREEYIEQYGTDTGNPLLEGVATLADIYDTYAVEPLTGYLRAHPEGLLGKAKQVHDKASSWVNEENDLGLSFPGESFVKFLANTALGITDPGDAATYLPFAGPAIKAGMRTAKQAVAAGKNAANVAKASKGLEPLYPEANSLADLGVVPDKVLKYKNDPLISEDGAIYRPWEKHRFNSEPDPRGTFINDVIGKTREEILPGVKEKNIRDFDDAFDDYAFGSDQRFNPVYRYYPPQNGKPWLLESEFINDLGASSPIASLDAPVSREVLGMVDNPGYWREYATIMRKAGFDPVKAALLAKEGTPAHSAILKMMDAMKGPGELDVNQIINMPVRGWKP